MELKIADFALLAARLLLAAVFLLAGAAKLFDPPGFRKTLRDFGLPSMFARPMVLLLPVLEVAIAAALITPSLAWHGAWSALILLTVFLIVIAITMVRGRRPVCHCFGQLHSAPVGWQTLIRDSSLAVCAAWIVSRGNLSSEPNFWAWFASLDSLRRKVVLVVVCIAGLAFFRAVSQSLRKGKPDELERSPGVDDWGIPEEPPIQAAAKQTLARPLESPSPARTNVRGIGLPIGTPAPEFELPRIDGEKCSLQSLRNMGNDVLLVFSSPSCASCMALVSNLAHWAVEIEGLPSIVLISCGTVEANLAKLQGFKPSQVLLQREFEVADAYDSNMTPAAVLVGEDGLIRSDLVVGGIAIRQLLVAIKPGRDKPGHDKSGATPVWI